MAGDRPFPKTQALGLAPWALCGFCSPYIFIGGCDTLDWVSEQPSLVWYMSIRGWRKIMAPFRLSRRGKRVAAVTVHREHQPVASCELALSRFWCKGHPRCQGQALNGALLSGAQANTRLLPTIFYIHTSDFFSKFLRYPREG